MADIENVLSSYTRKEQNVIFRLSRVSSEMLWYTAHTSGAFLEQQYSDQKHYRKALIFYSNMNKIQYV